MDLRKLKTLIELVQESGIAELEVTEGEEKVRITRTVANAMQPVMQYAAPMMAAMPNTVKSLALRCLFNLSGFSCSVNVASSVN